MNNKIKFLTIGLAAFVIGMGVNNFAMSDVPANFKVAIVDVPEVVASSSQVQALKKEQQAKAQDMIKYIEKARKDVAATTDEKKKKALEEKYNKELITKREAIEKLALKYYPNDNKENRNNIINKEYNAMCMIELDIEHITGKEAIELVKTKKENK